VTVADFHSSSSVAGPLGSAAASVIGMIRPHG
jgi:hypothetical protein